MLPARKLGEHVSWTMFLEAHRAHSPRRRRRLSHDHVLVFAPDSRVLRWIEHELFGETMSTQVVDALADVVTSLTLVPPPWPQLLIVDAEAIAPAEVELLSVIRGAGWPGMVIAIGETSAQLEKSLGVDLVLPRTLQCESLRKAIKNVGSQRPTIPMRRIG